MGLRQNLHQKLIQIIREFDPDLVAGKDKHVYFQPPTGYKLSYPCIIYRLNRMPPRFANNKPYQIDRSYHVTLIDTDPDGILKEKLAEMPMCTLTASFTSDNLYHYNYDLYY